MKRLPLLFTLLALIFLAVSATYWGMQLYKPQQRPIAAAPPAAMPELSPDAAATLFGGQAVANVATNYQLTGIVAAGRDSVAIVVAEGQPPKALKVGHELSPGVSISEVHPRYIMLSEGGVMKRIDLAADTKPAIALSGDASSPMPVPPQMARPSIAPAGAMPTTEPQTAPGAVQSPPPPGEVNPVVPQGQEAPQEVPQEPPQEGPPADVAPPPNQPQMPAPTRSAGSPVNSGNPVR
jgi:general secretion pathway protein C